MKEKDCILERDAHATCDYLTAYEKDLKDIQTKLKTCEGERNAAQTEAAEHQHKIHLITNELLTTKDERDNADMRAGAAERKLAVAKVQHRKLLDDYTNEQCRHGEALIELAECKQDCVHNLSEAVGAIAERDAANAKLSTLATILCGEVTPENIDFLEEHAAKCVSDLDGANARVKALEERCAQQAFQLEGCEEEGEAYKEIVDALNAMTKRVFGDDTYDESPVEHLTLIEDAFITANARVKALEEALEEALGMNTPYPIYEVLSILGTAVDHLLHDLNCDHLGYEGASYARKQAAIISEALLSRALGAKEIINE